MKSEALIATEAMCADGRTAPRVSLADIEANIMTEVYMRAGNAARHVGHATSGSRADDAAAMVSLDVLTICLLVTRNGFTILGKSAPASPDNFDEELGRKLAYEDAVNQLWPLMGYALREKLSVQ